MKINKAILLIAATSFALTACNKQKQESATELASPVSVVEVSKSSISKYNSTSGTALSDSEVDLKSEVAGKYKLQRNPRTGAPYKLGDKVMAGEVIVKFENNEYENDIAIDSKRLSLEIAEQEEAKNRAIYEKGGVTLRELKNAEVAITNAKYSYENAKLNLEKMNVKAPFTGVIVNLPHYTPNVQLASGTSIVSIMSYSKMVMEINLPESAINEVKTGQEVFITHYTLPNDTIRAMVSELSPAISSETRTFKGKLLIDNDKMKLRPGMFVKADIVVKKAENTIVVPKEIVMSNRNRKYVYVAEKGFAKMRDIRTGIEDNDNIEVLHGLKVEEQLITRGYETLRDNSKIKIQK
ncbi:MAG: efflux RND transporter periplasmic adaptor subunit [Bacteroidaceae bacterium]|nr:efflux RND transporter periplasmic adaptor subunit [Bacteroidaceae bacterium]